MYSLTDFMAKGKYSLSLKKFEWKLSELKCREKKNEIDMQNTQEL
jgi:hypothetical protein